MELFPCWESALRPAWPALRGGADCDVVIIGGGLTGVTCAAMFSAIGCRVVLLEARFLGCGATWCCTGKITSQLTNVYAAIAAQAGLSAAARFAALERDAVTGLGELCRRLGVPLTEQSVYVFAETTDDLPALHRLHQLEAQIGLPLTQAIDAGSCPFPVELSLRLEHQLLVKPLPYLLALASFSQSHGCRIFEHSPALQVEGRQVYTPEGHVQAGHMIFATGIPLGCHDLSILSMMEQRTGQTLVLEGGTPFMNSHLSVQPDELTLRPLPDGALLSWDMGRTGSPHFADRQLILQRTLSALLPDFQLIESSLRQDVRSMDGLPLIGAMQPGEGHRLMASGYCGWGLTGSFIAAQILAGQITGHPRQELAWFRPHRPAPRLAEALRTARSYGQGLLHPGSPTCPHMGGKLRYNPDSQLWECPCHGSVFTVLGEPQNAPAHRPAKITARQRKNR